MGELGRKPRWGRRLSAIGIALGACALGVAALELLLRAQGWEERTANFRLPGNHAVAFDTSGKFRRHPRRFFSVGADYRVSDEHAGRYATGAWPFRGRPAEPARAGTVRIAVLGDSCVYGESVDACATLPSRIQDRLAALGRGPCSVQVLNFGVTGYSTLQIRLCLEEVLARWQPAAVVLYPAAWNDQAPRLGSSDEELLGEGARPWHARLLPAASNAVRRLRGEREPESFEEDKEEILAAVQENRPRVPAARVQAEVARMLGMCRQDGVPAIVVLPPHPAATPKQFPRTAEDRESTRRAALAARVPIVDGPALFAASEGDDAQLFLDSVHPSPDGYALLAEPIGDLLVPLLPPAPDTGSLRILALEPRSAWILGDELLTLTLAGWDGDELPAVTVGGAPLVDLRRTGRARVEGLLPANGPGEHPLVVETSSGCAVGSFRMRRPEVELVGGSPPHAVVRSRAGDRVKVIASHERREAPRWGPAGPQWVADGFRSLFDGRLTCGPDGRAECDLPGLEPLGFDPSRPLHMQAVVDVLTPESHVLDTYLGELTTWRPEDRAGR